MKSVHLLAGGYSIRENIEKGLWNLLEGEEIWGINYTYKLCPLKLHRQLFCDYNFFKNNIADLENLAKLGVPIYAKSHSHYNKLTDNYIKQYNTCREPNTYKGIETLKQNEPHIYIGRLGLSGTFALSLAIAEGYTDIFLWGFDFGTTSIQEKNTHWYQPDIKVVSHGVGNPGIYRIPSNDSVKIDVKDYEVFTKTSNINIYNISPNSNIPYFTKYTFEQFKEILNSLKGNNPNV